MKTLLARGDVDASRIAAIGYCLGGSLSLELAFAGAPLAAAVAFHAGLNGIPSKDAAKVQGRLLLCIGSDDPVVPPEARAAFEADLKGSGVRWQINLYGGVRHSFTNPDSGGPPEMVAYDEWADRDSWNAMTALFDEVFD